MLGSAGLAILYLLHNNKIIKKVFIVVNLSISLKDKTATDLDRVARLMDRPRSWVASEAIEMLLAHYEWMNHETEAAIAAIDAGAELIPHEQVVTRAEARAKKCGA